MIKQFKIIPILGRKSDTLPDDSTMFKSVGDGVALSHDAGGKNYDLKRYRNAVTKSFGDYQRSASANAQKTLCMGLFELYDGTNRNHIYFDNGLVYYYDSSWDPVVLADTYLNYDAQTGSFTAGNSITGGTSGATADIVFVYDAGSSDGTLFLENVSGTFQNNEIIYVASYGSQILTNYNFESGFTGGLADDWSKWGASQTYAEETVDIHGGSSAQKITCAADDETIGIAQSETLESGSFYEHSAWVKCSNGNNVNLYNIGLSSEYKSFSVVADTWTKLTWIDYAIDSDSHNFIIYQSVANSEIGDILRIDDVSSRQITNAALANGTVSTTTFANDSADLYSTIRIGSYMAFADRAENTPMKWQHGDGTLSTLIASGTKYKFRYLLSFQRRVLGLYSDQANGDIDVRWSTAWPATAITSLNFPAANQLYIPNDDSITGGIILNRDQCFITCENSIQQVAYYPDYSTPFRIYTIVPDQGFENHHSLVNANGRVYGFNRNYGFCEYTGGRTLNPISEDILPDLTNIDSNYYVLIYGKHIAKEKKIKWAVPLEGGSANDSIVSYNYDTGQWEIEDKVARCIDEWLLYSSQTWTTLTTAVGGTGIWTDAGTTRWTDWASANWDTMIANTDGHVYSFSGSTANTGTPNGYREEPILSFGNPRTFKNILEIWFDIGSSGSFSIDTWHRSGNTTGELLASAWEAMDSVSANSPYDAVIKTSKSGRLHQIKWGTNLDSEDFVVNGITFKYTEGGEV